VERFDALRRAMLEGGATSLASGFATFLGQEHGKYRSKDKQLEPESERLVDGNQQAQLEVLLLAVC
jgi:hemerythrin-like domain-containing protein